MIFNFYSTVFFFSYRQVEKAKKPSPSPSPANPEKAKLLVNDGNFLERFRQMQGVMGKTPGQFFQSLCLPMISIFIVSHFPELDNNTTSDWLTK